MAIPESIKKLANDIRTKIYGREVRESLAKGIEEAGNIADETKTRQNNLETQFQSVLDKTTGKDVVSAPEILAARVSYTGTSYTTLKERLDQEHKSVTTQLAKMENIQITPLQFGAKADGSDDLQALQTCFDKLHNGEAGTLDLCGKTYHISDSILVNSMWKKKIKNGTIKALDSFPLNKYILQSTDEGSVQDGSFGYKLEDITFDAVTLDANFRGGCFDLWTYLRIIFTNGCDFRRYTTYGLRTSDNPHRDGHELILDNVYFRANFSNETNEKGVALKITKNDGYFTNLIIAGGKKGIELFGRYNYFDNVHIYGTKEDGIHQIQSSQNTFSNLYLDCVTFRISEPWATTITNANVIVSGINDPEHAVFIFENNSGTPKYFAFMKFMNITVEGSGNSVTPKLIRFVGDWVVNTESYIGCVFTGITTSGVENNLKFNHFTSPIMTNKIFLNSMIPGRTDTTQTLTNALTNQLGFNINPETGMTNIDGAGIADGVILESDNRYNWLGNYPIALRVKTTQAPGGKTPQTPEDRFYFYKNGDFQPLGNYKSSDGSTGVSGSFTTNDGKTITIKNGIVTSIV